MTNTNRNRGLAAERYFAVRLQRAAGRVTGVYENLVTSTGRVGQLTDLGFDILVGNPGDGVDLVGESKQRKTTFGADALRALKQLFRISVEWEREPVFCASFPDNEFVDTKKGKKRLPKRWVMFTLEYAEKLIRTQRMVNQLRRESETFNSLWIGADLQDAIEQNANLMVEEEAE